MMPLGQWMQRSNGVAHSTAIRDAGYSAQTVKRAIDAGHLSRVRRSWLVDRDCSQERRLAASAGGRITCVSAARTLGLWDHGDEEVHVAVAPTASRVLRTGLVVHWAQGPIDVPSRSSEEPLLNVLFQTARCLEPIDALAVWESAIRTRLVAPDELSQVRWRCASAERLAAVAGSLSDSGLETRFVWIMRRIGVTVRQQVWIDGHPLDGLIGECLAIQIDGFAHHRSASDRRRDIRADARLALRGYTVLRFDFHQILFDEQYVTETVRRAMAQGLHLARRAPR